MGSSRDPVNLIMHIKDCTINATLQKGFCQIGVININATGAGLIFTQATANAHFVFLTGTYVVYSFEDVAISESSRFFGVNESSGKLEGANLTALQKASVEHLLLTALNWRALMCKQPMTHQGMYLG